MLTVFKENPQLDIRMPNNYCYSKSYQTADGLYIYYIYMAGSTDVISDVPLPPNAESCICKKINNKQTCQMQSS